MIKPDPRLVGKGPPARGELVRDLVCGMDVVKDGALTHEVDGRTYHFCSQECRDRFKADPARYVK
jgi:YHS domain-containing protein